MSGYVTVSWLLWGCLLTLKNWMIGGGWGHRSASSGHTLKLKTAIEALIGPL
ncbi:hypothetical protein ICN46_11435 [Polynucleobacter sp. Latsch14-2]|uniref:hypothetical protein n=1 Tax=Polynucleobacter sp. Latsch14-2 TaxID=2576920 RepID=UPI001BFD3F79|nr:hypothetical protein [Polynucleobacter sp. Latsch14-2]MBT8582796.1 hypothetical protein [Polynucleobacter paneuropaeus]MBT8611991.1 hypothetical protein [Polynucleobacter paneuropaeus]MBU3615502.1 hypothetical protein [Polynucleobacter sp. Latsch14-2]